MPKDRKIVACAFAGFALAFVASGPARAVSFAPAVSYNAGNSPHAVAAADFNGDGVPDLAAVNNLSNNVSILIGKGDGTFATAVNYAVGKYPTSVAVGDFNGDGKLDLVVTNSNNFMSGANLSILIGNGDGTFQTQVPYASTLGAPYFVAVGDFNGDNKLDLAVACHGGDVSIYLGNGDGTFQTAVNYPAGGNPQAIAVGDFNGDQILDLAVANKSSNNVSILIGNGNGAFGHPANIVVGTSPSDVAAGDFNGDGILDLAVSNFGSNNLAILIGVGNGTFATPSYLTAGTNPAGVAVADFNGDGKADLAESNQARSADNVGVFLGNGDGTFQNATQYIAGGGPGLLVAIDLNHDGAPDIAVADSGAEVDVLLNAGGTFLSTTSSLNPAPPAQPVTFTTKVLASIAGSNTPTGTVTFEDGSTFLGTGTVSNGQASFTTSSLTVGAHTINALYSGDANFNPNSAPPLTQTIGTPLATLSATSLTFGLQLLNTASAPQQVTLTNTGTALLSITNIVETGSGSFSEVNTCGSSLAVNASCTITVTFTPTGINALTGTITITDNASDSPQAISLTGTGTEVQLAPSSLVFPAQKVGTSSSPQGVTVTNVGKASMNVNGIHIAGANASDFSQTNNCGTSLGAGKSCTINVTFKPKATGTRTAGLGVQDNGGGSPQMVGLSGTGT